MTPSSSRSADTDSGLTAPQKYSIMPRSAPSTLPLAFRSMRWQAHASDLRSRSASVIEPVMHSNASCTPFALQSSLAGHAAVLRPRSTKPPATETPWHSQDLPISITPTARRTQPRVTRVSVTRTFSGCPPSKYAPAVKESVWLSRTHRSTVTRWEARLPAMPLRRASEGNRDDGPYSPLLPVKMHRRMTS